MYFLWKMMYNIRSMRECAYISRESYESEVLLRC